MEIKDNRGIRHQEIVRSGNQQNQGNHNGFKHENIYFPHRKTTISSHGNNGGTINPTLHWKQ